MKRRLLSGILVLSLLATGCIKTVESDGVKTMRTSQAALLTAMAGATTTNATADAALKAAQATYQAALAAKLNADAEIAKAESAAKLATQKITDATLVENNRSLAAMNALKEAMQAATDAKTKASLTEAIKVEQANTAYNLKVIANNITNADLILARTKETDRAFAAANALSEALKTEQNRNTLAMNALTEALKMAQDAQAKARLTEQIAEEAAKSKAALDQISQQMAEQTAQSELNLKQIAANLENVIAQQESQKSRNAATLISYNQQLLDAQQQLEQTQRQYELTAAQAKIEQAKQIELLKITAATAKNSVATSLINEYNNSFSLWNTTNNNIISYNRDILSLQTNLKLSEIDAPVFVSTIKSRLDAQKIVVALKTTDLERASLPTDKLKSEYEAEIAAINLELPTLNKSADAAYAEYLKLTDASNLAMDAYSAALSSIAAFDNNLGYSGSYSTVYNNNSPSRYLVYSGMTAAYGRASWDYQAAQLDSTTAYQNYYTNTSWLHYSWVGLPIGGSRQYMNRVTLEKAVITEKGDIIVATQEYPSVADAEDVKLAETAAKAGLDKYNAAVAKCATTLAALNVAKTASNAVFVTLNSLYVTYINASRVAANAYVPYNNATNVLNAKKSRLVSLENTLASIANPPSLQNAKDALAAATVVLDKWTAIYDSAVKALADGTSFSYSNNGYAGSWAGLAGYLDQIKDLQASLVIEQAKLVKYKADMDSWAKQVAAALAS